MSILNNLKKLMTHTPAELNELLELHAQVEAIQPILQRYEALLKKIKAEAEKAPGEVVTYANDKGEVVFGPHAKTRNVKDKAALIERIGQDKFNEIAKVNMTDIDKLVLKDEQTFVEITEGARKLRSITLHV